MPEDARQRLVDVESLMERAERLLLEGEYAEAVELCTEASRREPWNPGIWSQLGLGLRGAGEDQKALGAYGVALEIEQDHVPAWLGIAIIYNDYGDYERALEAAQEAAEKTVRWAFPLAVKAMVLSNMRRHEEALVAAEYALELDPTDAGALHRKAHSLYCLGRKEEAQPVSRLAAAAQARNRARNESHHKPKHTLHG